MRYQLHFIWNNDLQMCAGSKLTNRQGLRIKINIQVRAKRRSSRGIKLRHEALTIDISVCLTCGQKCSTLVWRFKASNRVLLYYSYQTYLLEWSLLFDRVMGLGKGICVYSAHSSWCSRKQYGSTRNRSRLGCNLSTESSVASLKVLLLVPMPISQSVFSADHGPELLWHFSAISWHDRKGRRLHKVPEM